MIAQYIIIWIICMKHVLEWMYDKKVMSICLHVSYPELLNIFQYIFQG
jgi:hypothetical protein